MIARDVGGIFTSEASGYAVQDTRENRSEAGADKNETQQLQIPDRQEQNEDSEKGNRRAAPDHRVVRSFHGNEAGNKPTEHNAAEIDRNPFRCRVGRKSEHIDDIGRSPGADQKFHTAIKTERNNPGQNAFDFQNFQKALALFFCGVLRLYLAGLFRLFPFLHGQQHDEGEKQL